MKTLGLALSGGGMRCLAQAGALKALDEHDIRPDFMAGISGGAIVSVLYAQGYKPDDILSFFADTPVFRWSQFSAWKAGILDSKKFAPTFTKYLKSTDFSDLSVPVTIGATDLQNAEVHFFSEGDLLKPLMASCALPGLFSPIKIEGTLYADGGILNNFPVEPLKDRCDVRLGMYVNPVPVLDRRKLRTTLRVLMRGFEISTFSRSFYKFDRCDVMFYPEKLTAYGLFSRRNHRKIFDIGYDEMMEKVDDLKQKIGRPD